jgi:DMSO/TMAO reductase YedYZ heme-binding membrane subunit
MTKRKAPYTGNVRLLLQIESIALFLGILAIPPIIIAISGTATLDATWTTLRLAALLAFSLIFVSIITGSFRPIFNRTFKPHNVQRIHVANGLAGFSLALAHGVLAAIYGLTGYKTSAVVVGPIVLGLLFIVILTAIARRSIRQMWRWIHRLNYLIFAAVFVHGLVLGYDLKSDLFLRICFSVYAAVVAAGLVFRLVINARGKKARASTEEV